MKSPLRKRLPRELKSEFGKYLVVFIMMAITIGFVSGFLVADGSMLRAYDDSFQKYNIEDGYSGLQVLWHFPITVHYFRIIMIRCLML